MSVEEILNECENVFKKQDYSCLDYLCRKISEGDRDNSIGSRFDYLCRNALEEDDDNIVALNYRAFRFSRSGHHYLVFPILNQILERDPANYFAYNTKAMSHMDKEEYEEALESCEKGLKIKDYDWLRRNKIETLICLNRIKEAHEFYKEREIPNYTFVKGLVDYGKYSRLEEEYAERLSDEKLIDYYFKRCRYLHHRSRKPKKERYEERIELCDKILELDRDNRLALLYKIDSFGFLEREDEVIRWSDYTMNLYPNDPAPYLFKAETLYCYFRDLDGAIENYEKGLSLVDNMDNYPARNEVVDLLYEKAKQVNRKEALSIYDRILFYNRREFEALDMIDSILEEHSIDYEYSEYYKESLMLKTERDNRFKDIDDFLDAIEIGEYDEDYVNGCSQFKDYDSFDEYVRDVIICLMESLYNFSEESARERVRYSMDELKSSYEHEEPAGLCIIEIGYSCG